MFFLKKNSMPSKEIALPGRSEPIETAEKHFVSGRLLKGPYPNQMLIAVFGLGCFWGAERKFWSLDGVWISSVGYCAGLTLNPNYEEVCTGQTGHNEVVQVVFDPGKISYLELLKPFLKVIIQHRECVREMTLAHNIDLVYILLLGNKKLMQI